MNWKLRTFCDFWIPNAISESQMYSLFCQQPVHNFVWKTHYIIFFNHGTAYNPGQLKLQSILISWRLVQSIIHMQSRVKDKQSYVLPDHTRDSGVNPQPRSRNLIHNSFKTPLSTTHFQTRHQLEIPSESQTSLLPRQSVAGNHPNTVAAVTNFKNAGT